MKLLTKSMLVAVTVLAAAVSAPASPLIIATVEGTTNPNLTGYTTELQVMPGQTIYYEVTLSLASPGTKNSNVSRGALVTQTPGKDGINGLALGLSDSDGLDLGSATINAQNGWMNAPGRRASRRWRICGNTSAGSVRRGRCGGCQSDPHRQFHRRNGDDGQRNGQ